MAANQEVFLDEIEQGIGEDYTVAKFGFRCEEFLNVVFLVSPLEGEGEGESCLFSVKRYVKLEACLTEAPGLKRAQNLTRSGNGNSELQKWSTSRVQSTRTGLPAT
ncbi:hypothetical protein AMELA_G00278950 [Ameiurus melas]|uniref:Uncharacterized protein n=1 Tax=Ameiurus melas TaxID=219545 RepID=A0A7J5ZKA6_AMEME|nr:hypothetical protein AMELA_G00278950 [Ameiurus melas]